jgi:hypothetical protein
LKSYAGFVSWVTIRDEFSAFSSYYSARVSASRFRLQSPTMTHKDFRRLALSLTGAIEASHMGHPDFRANNKIFASLHPDLKLAMVKLTPDQQKTFIAADADSFAPESGAWGRSGCTRVTLATVNEDSLGEALTFAWQNIAARLKLAPKRAGRTSRKRS